jgi:hypothetical protein
MRILTLAMMLGCTSENKGADTASGAESDTDTDADSDSDTDADTDSDIEFPDDLNGEIVDPALDPTEFSAMNMDDTARSLADLTDGPTIMWFYPAAGSYG